MVTEQDIAQLCLDIYTAQPGQWDQLELPADGVAFGIKDFPEATALIFRGSVTLQDLCVMPRRSPIRCRMAGSGRFTLDSLTGFPNCGPG